MVGRCVVIGDPCPWVAQSAEAFLSKIFACSYSIAGLNVLSGNPADHLVHRHTHRVVRGSLLICGRPDGRLTALASLEASTCLAVNQASSIQSLGGTCESITIGHNAFELPLSYKGICLETHRPKFLCEKLLDDTDIVSTSTGGGGGGGGRGGGSLSRMNSVRGGGGGGRGGGSFRRMSSFLNNQNAGSSSGGVNSANTNSARSSSTLLGESLLQC